MGSLVLTRRGQNDEVLEEMVRFACMSMGF